MICNLMVSYKIVGRVAFIYKETILNRLSAKKYILTIRDSGK